MNPLNDLHTPLTAGELLESNPAERLGGILMRYSTVGENLTSVRKLAYGKLPSSDMKSRILIGVHTNIPPDLK